MDFDAIRAAAEATPLETKKVHVCVNTAVAKKRAALLERIENAKDADKREAGSDDRLSAPTPSVTDRQDAAAKALREFDEANPAAFMTIKLTQMPGDVWSALTLAHPMRLDVPLDRHYGYNYTKVTELGARLSGVAVDDEGEHQIPEDFWQAMFSGMDGKRPILSPYDAGQIENAVFELNDWEPRQQIEAAVKSYAGA